MNNKLISKGIANWAYPQQSGVVPYVIGFWRRIISSLFLSFALMAVLVVISMPVWPQTCDPKAEKTSPTRNFVIRRPGTVTDKETGLTWMRCALGDRWSGTSCISGKQWYVWFSWIDAMKSARKLEFAGYSDWRLPKLSELETILEVACENPMANIKAFPNMTAAKYWTSTMMDNSREYAWMIDFNRGDYITEVLRTSSYRVLLVRGRMKQKKPEKTPRKVVNNNSSLFTDGVHDPANDLLSYLQDPGEALSKLPASRFGTVDWVEALAQKKINPRANLDGTEKIFELDFTIMMKNTLAMPYVPFPHKAHTQWLTCSNCHPDIFIPRMGANPIKMDAILRGEFCGRCHGRVAFSIFECDRCHSVLHEGAPNAWWENSESNP